VYAAIATFVTLPLDQLLIGIWRNLALVAVLILLAAGISYFGAPIHTQDPRGNKATV
jgi:hypothetical protein